MFSRKEWMTAVLCDAYLKAQQEYDEYWVKNIWGFGDKMRDYLLEGRRRIRHGNV